MQKILIIQTAFLGDVILATPLLSELKRIFPDASIDFLVRKGNEGLLNNNPHCNTVFVFNKKEGKLAEMRRLIRTFRSNKYDLVVNLQRFASSGLITALSGGKKKYGFSKNPFSFAYTQSFSHEIGNGLHEVERNLSIIKEFGALPIKRPELYPSSEHFSKTAHYHTDHYYCIAPASVWFTKQLPEQKWVELINTFSDKATIYLLGGKDDFNLCNSILQKVKHPKTINLAGELNLLESAALISKSTRTYVNDSGPLHIASAVNAPVTAYFCSTVPSFGFGPLSDDSKIVEVTHLDCRPCGLHGHKQCPKSHFKCGNEIPVNL